MEALAVLIGAAAVIFYVVAPFISLARAKAAQDEAATLRSRLQTVEDAVLQLRQELQHVRHDARDLTRELARPPVAEPMPAPAAPTPVAEASFINEPVGPLPAEIWHPPPVVVPIAEPVASVVTPPVTPPAASVAQEVPVPGAIEVPAAPDLRPAFDLEKLLGVRGAAALGGVALVIAGGLFAKYSIENNLIPPAVRIALLLLVAVSCLVGSEVVLRRGYAATANATAGAGVALLYSSFYAAHGLYQLIPLPATFALMALTTVVACLLSLRHDASFIAILGLMGGFATPLLLSTGHDQPVGLFSYILLLDIGVLYIALRRAWSRLAYLSLAATIFLQIGWASKFLTPGKLPIALGSLGIFGLLYLLLPSLARREQRDDLSVGAVLGGLYPFAFVLLLAGDADYAAQWPLLAGFNALLSIALIIISLRRGQLALLLAAAAATAATLLLWASHQLSGASRVPASLTAVGLVLLYQIPPSLRRRAPVLFARLSPVANGAAALEGAGVILIAALGLYTVGLCQRGLGQPPALFLGLLGVLFIMGLERCAAAVLPALPVLFPAAVAVIVQVWFFAGAADARLLHDLAVPVLLALGYAVNATWLASKNRDRLALETDIGALLATLVALVGLFACLGRDALAAAPLPLFLALCPLLGLLVLTPLRDDQTWLWLLALVTAAAFCELWRQDSYQRADAVVVGPFYVGLYLTFLLLPHLWPVALRPAWLRRRLPLLTTGLAGPLFFPSLHQLWRTTLGTAAMGALPLALAFTSLGSLALLRRRFLLATPAPGEAEAGSAEFARARLRGLALLAAVTLGFIAVAIPLQLDREWITLGWALEAAAVWWLFRRLPHPGLKALGLGLYLTVAARLLPSQTVLHYHERGLPIVNWILYTYGIAALCFLVGAAALAPLEPIDPDQRSALERLLPAWLRLPGLVRGLALLLVFVLINLEIADFFSPGRYAEWSGDRSAARDLTTSVAWGLYALLLLGIGMWRRSRVLRFASLGFMLLTITKVFLYDLSSLKGLYQVLSFLGLALSLIMVSLLYQRFVFRAQEAAQDPGAVRP